MRLKPCDSCGVTIAFLKTEGGKLMPVDADSVEGDDDTFDPEHHVPHWKDCPGAESHRRARERKCASGCGATIPSHLLLCMSCWRQVPPELRAQTTKARAGTSEKTALLRECAAAVKRSRLL